jgi:hypothetical protein
VLEALKEPQTFSEIAQKFEVYPAHVASGFEPEKLTIYSGTLLVQISGTLLVISDNWGVLHAAPSRKSIMLPFPAEKSMAVCKCKFR